MQISYLVGRAFFEDECELFTIPIETEIKILCAGTCILRGTC